MKREWMKQARKEAGLTCSQMAERMEISDIYYQSIENGRRQQKMTIETAMKLSQILKVPMEIIINYETR